LLLTVTLRNKPNQVCIGMHLDDV
jgi:hypothetical protein